jgi:hypothetical protein
MVRITLTFREENDMTKTRHSPYSPDLTPFGFFLFGHVKQLLQGAEFPDRDSLFDAVVQILTRREKLTLNYVFLS